MSSDSKRRRVGEGDSGVDSIPPVGGGGESNTLLHQELREMKSTMNELMGNMTNMMQMMHSQSNVIDNMQGDINRLTQKCNSMETSIKQTTKNRFDSVDDKLKYHEILLQNQKWKYSAPLPSPGYWNNLDEDERYQAKVFLEQIKRYTEEMRYGTGNGEISIVADLPYNEAFLPHWQEFSNALQQYHYHLKHSSKQREESKLYLYGITLPKEVIDLLAKALKSTHFEELILMRNHFGQKGIEFSLDYLKNNPILKAFSLANNPINNMNDINKLCKIVKVHPTIECLALASCKGEDINGYEMLKTVMDAGKSKLVNISLTGNQISTKGDTFISDFFATNPVLVALSLQRNQLDDQDAIGIAQALKQNAKLRQLDLTHNNITKIGWKALRKAELDDTSLNAASDSNHTCAIEYPSVEDDDEIRGVDTSEMNNNPVSEMHLDYLYVRQKKIYTVLSSRNKDCSNVKHFENVPVERLPEILQSIQEYSNYHEEEDISQVRGHVEPLSIVYEICRHWEGSLSAFEALSLSK